LTKRGSLTVLGQLKRHFLALAPVEKAGNFPVVALCDYRGDVSFEYASQIQVVEVDGKPPDGLLPSPWTDQTNA